MKSLPALARSLLVAGCCTLLTPLRAGADQPSLSGDPEPGALALRAGTIHLDGRTSLHAQPSLVLDSEQPLVLQIDGPLTRERQRKLAEAGVQLGAYLPWYAYIVRLPAGFRMSALSGLDFVRWVGPFDPAWKLDPAIGNRTYQTPSRQVLDAQGRFLLAVALFAGTDLDAAVARLRAIDGVIVTDVQPRGGEPFVELIAPKATCARLAELPEVQWIEEASEAVLRNSTNRWIVQSNLSGVTPVWDRGITGVGQVAGHIDGGVNQSHCSFRDPAGNPVGPTHRKIVAYFGSTTYSQHGTHTAGTFVGDEQPVSGGTTNRGLAYSAKLAFTNLSSVTSTNLLSKFQQNHAAGGRLHSNSWGDDGTTSYTSWCADIDKFSYENEDDLVLFAVTNLNTAIKTPENAKNCVGVAATRDTPSQGNHCSGGTAFTNDGRRKPEVMAPGCSTISSSGSGTSCNTAGLTGTSMACPAVSGAGLLVRQYFMDGFYPSGAATPADAFTPTGALIKATLINSAVDMTGIAGFPSNQEGWGRVLLDNALYFSADARKLLVLNDLRNAGGMTTGESHSFTVNVLGNAEPLKATLVWTEKEAALNANPAYINNLNLVVTAPGDLSYLGNVFSGGQSVTGGSADTRNNVEQVLLNSPPTGVYTVRVDAAAVNTLTPQGYALIVTGDLATFVPAPTIASITPNQGAPNTGVDITDLAGSNFVPGATVRLTRWFFPAITATDVVVVNPNRITCRFNLGGAMQGHWTVEVTNPNTLSATLPNGFLITVACLPGDLNLDGAVNGSDIRRFTDIVLYGGGTETELCAGDLTPIRDGLVTTSDMGPFVDCLVNGECR